MKIKNNFSIEAIHCLLAQNADVARLLNELQVQGRKLKVCPEQLKGFKLTAE